MLVDLFFHEELIVDFGLPWSIIDYHNINTFIYINLQICNSWKSKFTFNRYGR